MRFILPLFCILLTLTACLGEIEKHPLTDDTAPILLDYAPAKSSLNQPINVRIELTFDDSMLISSCSRENFYITEAGSQTKLPINNYYLTSTNQIFLYLASNLKPNTTYHVTLQKGPQNLSQLAYGGTNWSFTTGTHLTNYAPKLTITAPTNGQIIGKNLAINGNYECAQYLAYSVNLSNFNVASPLHGGSYLAGTWSTNNIPTDQIPFKEGKNTLYVYAMRGNDGSGEMTVKSVIFTLDTAAPSISITSHTNNQKTKGTTTISGTATDYCLKSIDWMLQKGATTLITWTNASGTNSWQFSFDTTLFEDGTYTMLVKATDVANNTTTNSINLKIANWHYYITQVDHNSSEMGTIFFTNSYRFLSGNSSGLRALDGQDGFTVELGNYDSSFNHVATSTNYHFLLSAASGSIHCYKREKTTGTIQKITSITSTPEYATYTSTNDLLFLAYAETATKLILAQTLPSWSSMQITNHPSGSIHAISACHDNGNIWVSYILRQSSSSGTLFAKKITLQPFNSTTYNLGTIEAYGDNSGLCTSLCTDEQNNLYLFYGSGQSALNCYTFNGTTWTHSILDDSADGVQGIDSLFHNGEIHISYISYGRNLKYVRKTTTGWKKAHYIGWVTGTKTKLYADSTAIKISTLNNNSDPIIFYRQ